MPSSCNHAERRTGRHGYCNACRRGRAIRRRLASPACPDGLASLVAGLAEPLRGLADPVPEPPRADRDLLAVYPMGDPHVGMYAWAQETGASFDLDIAERDLVRATKQLVQLAPPAHQALVVDLGDFFHADDQSNETKRGKHQLDVDSRWAKVLRTGVRIMATLVDLALTKHKRVKVICARGNHDDHSAIVLATCLEQRYLRDPRVEVDTSPAKYHYHRFGRCLLGVTHGDTARYPQLPGIMACDRPEDWAATAYRYWLTGHVHHDRVMEFPGCLVESFRTLAPRDAWHAAQGYRAGRDMKLDVYHRELGRVTRHVVPVL